MITMLSIYKQTLVIWNISTKYTRVMLESPMDGRGHHIQIRVFDFAKGFVDSIPTYTTFL